MDGEIRNLMKVWILAIASTCYCYTLSKATPKGIQRLILVVPIISLFTTLPFCLSSVHLGGPTAFYLLWLGNFKLLLFAFGVGPLSGRASLPHFLCALLLPIKARPGPPPATGLGTWVLFGVKLVVLACVVRSYDYRKSLPYAVVVGLYCCHLYLALEITLAVSGALARASLGLQFAPQFNEPYLTTSLQDFWGNRWNLMVSDILRLTVHNPIRNMASPLIGRRQAMVIGILASFLVSGLMHELIYYYLTRVSPTWEVTWFFVLQGACTAIEVMVKKAVSGKWRLHPLISGPLTIGFVAVTGVWLFFPQIFRNEVHEKVIDEYPIMVKFLKRNVLYYWL